MDSKVFKRILQDKCRLEPGGKVLAGVSGGADSLCLLHLLKGSGVPVVAAHLDHGLRPESGQDAAFVAQVCRDWGIPLRPGQEDVRAYCSAAGRGIEEGARELRYRFLFDQAREENAAAVAVAHHADDQVETILMHLLRGAGLSGLKGMTFHGILAQYSTAVPVLRPLLGLTRAEILEYCLAHSIPYRSDASNLDPTFFRNRLRHELIPLLETYNPQVREGILRTAAALQADFEWIEQAVAQALPAVVLAQGEGWLVLDRGKCLELDRGLRWNLLRRVVRAVQPEARDLDQQALLRLDQLVMVTDHGQADLGEHLVARAAGTELQIYLPGRQPLVLSYPQLAGDLFLDALPARATLANGWILEAERLAGSPGLLSAIRRTPCWEAWLAEDSIHGRMRLGCRAAGARVQPLGQGGKHARLSDLFINSRVPNLARDRYPLVCDAEKVLWLPGICLSEACRVVADGQALVHLRFRPPDQAG